MSTRLDEARGVAWRLFLTSYVLVTELIERDLAAAKLPPLSWYSVLWALERSPNHKLRLHELAEQSLLTRSNTTRLLDRLEAEKLICRERCPSDRRGAFAVITDEGLALRQKMWTVYANGIASYFADQMSDSEIEVLTRSLERILGKIEPNRHTTP